MHQRSDRMRAVWVAVMGLILAVCLVVYLMAGRRWLGPLELLGLDGEGDGGLLLDLRLRRALMATTVGGALAVAGAVFQALLRNPLADPFVVGVSGGAAIGGTLALLPMGMATLGVALWGRSVAVFVGSFVGAMGATAWLVAASRVRGVVVTNSLLLMGVVFNFFASAIVMFLKSVLAGTRLQELLYWLMGTLAPETIPWPLVLLTITITLGATAVIFARAKALNVLSMGDEFAHGSGYEPERLKKSMFLWASMLVASAVSLSGFVGFVGLVVPHGVRMLVGADHRWLIPGSALVGALFLLCADLLSRMAFPWLDTQLPVGVITSLVGGPLFITMLARNQRSGGQP